MLIRLILFFLLCSLTSIYAQEKVFRIGATLPLSGKVAFVGEAERRGLELAHEELKTKFPAVKIELLIQDNKAESREGVTQAQSFISKDKVDLVFASSTHISMAVAPIVAKAKRLFFYAAASPEPAKSSELSFRDFFDSADTGVVLARQILADNHNRIAYIGEQSDVCQLFLESLNANLAPHSLVFEESFIPGDPDFRALLTKLKATSRSALVLCAWRDSGTIMQRINELGLMNTKTYHWVAPFLPFSDTAEIRALYEKNHSVSSWYGILPARKDALKNIKFAEDSFEFKFIKKYNEFPRADSSYTYDDLMFIAEAVQACPQGDYSCISTYLKSHTHKGAGGDLKFTKEGLSTRPVFLMRVKNAEWEKLGTY